MIVRKLDLKEHGKTRRLWEQIFSEDTKRFLDYYYYFKTKENEIYVIEDENAIRSMLHLNPYLLQVEEKQFQGNYIIAVATEEAYRKRGYMGVLLRRAMQEMYNRKEPFTFLMPAAEAIYTPYDFRFVYDQKQRRTKGREDVLSIELADASIGDAEEMAEFFRRHFAENWQVYVVRDESYYQTLIFEQQSENGGIKLMRDDGRIVGMFHYADEDGLEIREPLYLTGYEEEFQKAIWHMRGDKNESAIVYADETQDGEQKPVIMLRILHLESLLSAMKVKPGEHLDCSFAVLDSIITQNSRIWRIQGGTEENREIQVRETEDSQGVLTISALTSLLFGYKTVEEIRQEEDVILTDDLSKELQKLQPLNQVYLNEVV